MFQSGRNDIGYPLAQLHNAVRATVGAARGRWPRAQVVILGAIPADLPLGPGILGVEATLKQAAAEDRRSVHRSDCSELDHHRE